MSKPHSRTADYLVYVGVRFFISLIQAIPLDLGCGLAKILAWIAYHVDRRHRLVAVDNMSRAFPELRLAAVAARVRAVYRHFCIMMVEMVHQPRLMRPTTWRRHIDVPRSRELLELLMADRPMLLVTGHLGNWEMAGFTLGLLGFRSYAIARTLDNPYLHDFLMHRFRQRTGQTILSKDGDFERIQAVLAGAGKLATLGDQDAGQRGMYVDFFGRPASTHKAVALLALEFRATLLVVAAVRVGGPLRYCCVLEDVILPEDYEGKPDAVRLMTQRFTAGLERMVRRYPDQYLWLHRRWKHQPKVKAAKQAA
jgi:KDO2-lipid IV(A) lauroyltransferase